jgi:hypothetical protein
MSFDNQFSFKPYVIGSISDNDIKEIAIKR